MFVESKATCILNVPCKSGDGTYSILSIMPGMNLVSEENWAKATDPKQSTFLQHYMAEEIRLVLPVEGTKGKEDFRGVDPKVAVALAKKMVDRDALKTCKAGESRGAVIQAIDARLTELDPRTKA